MSGCMTIATPLKSYSELQKVLLLTHDFPRSLNEGIAQYNRLTKKWADLREQHLSRFSKANNENKWQEFLLKTIAQ